MANIIIQESNQKKDNTKYISQEMVKNLFHYENGVLFWKVKRRRVHIGKVAGCASCIGKKYFMICVNGKLYKRSRLVWAFHNGDVDDGFVIDHINRDSLDDRIENLRIANSSQNAINRSIRSDNKSGMRGVHWNRFKNKWMAYIKINGKFKHLGYFENKEDAYKHYILAATEMQGFWNPIIDSIGKLGSI